MTNQQLILLNSFWEKQEEVEVLNKFEFRQDHFWGRIKLKSFPKEDLLFSVKVPLSYPFSNDTLSIRFLCENKKGIRHLNGDNSVCLLTPKKIDFEARLIEEIKLLKEWRNLYYINNTIDEKYDYLIVDSSDNNTFLFTDLNYKFYKGEFGSFFALPFGNNTKLSSNRESGLYYVQKIGKTECQWSKNIISETKDAFDGMYFYIEDEPINSQGTNITDWCDLNQYLNQTAKAALYSIKTKIKNKNLFIIVGYKIPNSEELHWQAIKIVTSLIPITGKRIAPNYYEYFFEKYPIHWCKTNNASYDRFYGRGALNHDLASKNILIIGNGAIGSSLAKTLVKAGATNISLCDMDFIEPGNLCRSDFFMQNISVPKCFATAQILHNLSPFVNVTIMDIIDKILFDPYKSITEEILNKYDLIFDCTSDMELTYYLDQLKLNCEILNMSISNKAREFVCISKSISITKEKHQLFEKLSLDEDKLIYEGTGCWSPTFEASYFDINSLLNLAVKNINKQYIQRKSFNSFVIKVETNNLSENLITIDY